MPTPKHPQHCHSLQFLSSPFKVTLHMSHLATIPHHLTTQFYYHLFSFAHSPKLDHKLLEFLSSISQFICNLQTTTDSHYMPQHAEDLSPHFKTFALTCLTILSMNMLKTVGTASLIQARLHEESAILLPSHSHTCHTLLVRTPGCI